MTVTFTLDGLDEAIAEFRATPGAMTADARDVVESEGQAAANEIRVQYPVLSGELRSGVGVEAMREGDAVAGVRVVSRAPEAIWYEYGTAARHTSTGAFRGRMAPHFTFIRTLIAHRARLVAFWRVLFERFGLRPIG